MNSRSDYRLLSDNDVLDYVMGDITPPITNWPHLVLPAGPESLRRIASLVSCKMAFWGMPPPYCDDGAPYAPRDDPTRFQLEDWCPEINQTWLMESGGYATSAGFAMYLSAGLPGTVFEALWKSIPGDQIPDFELVWPGVARHLGTIRWVYIRLSDEYPLSIFVTRASDHKWVEELKSSLREDGLSFTSIVQEGGRQTWHLNHELRQLCGLNYKAAARIPVRQPSMTLLSPLSPEEENVREQAAKMDVSVHWWHDGWWFEVPDDERLLNICKLLVESSRPLSLTAVENVTNEGLRRIPTLASLREVTLTPPVNGAGLLELTRQPHLQKLSICEIRLTPQELSALGHFAVFSNLEVLELDFVEMPEEELEKIKAVQSIKTVIVDGDYLKGVERE